MTEGLKNYKRLQCRGGIYLLQRVMECNFHGNGNGLLLFSLRPCMDQTHSRYRRHQASFLERHHRSPPHAWIPLLHLRERQELPQGQSWGLKPIAHSSGHRKHRLKTNRRQSIRTLEGALVACNSRTTTAAFSLAHRKSPSALHATTGPNCPLRRTNRGARCIT